MIDQETEEQQAKIECEITNTLLSLCIELCAHAKLESPTQRRRTYQIVGRIAEAHAT